MTCKNEMVGKVPRQCPDCGIGKCKKTFNLITKATINHMQVKDIIIAAVEGQTGMKVKSLEFKVATQYDYRDQPYSTSFTGVEIEFST